MLFLIPLAIFLVAGYIFKNSSDELCYLAAAITGVSLLLTLVLVPWQIKLLLLVLGLIKTRQLLLQCEPGGESPANPSQEDKRQTLIYRGVCYESAAQVEAPTIEAASAEQEVPEQNTQPRTAAMLQSNFGFRYRGAAVHE